jgi:hypothetical protein
MMYVIRVCLIITVLTSYLDPLIFDGMSCELFFFLFLIVHYTPFSLFFLKKKINNDMYRTSQVLIFFHPKINILTQ